MAHKLWAGIPIACSQSRQIALAQSKQTFEFPLADVLRERVKSDTNPGVQGCKELILQRIR